MKEKLLSDFITSQYNIRKLEEVTKAFLEMMKPEKQFLESKKVM